MGISGGDCDMADLLTGRLTSTDDGTGSRSRHTQQLALNAQQRVTSTSEAATKQFMLFSVSMKLLEDMPDQATPSSFFRACTAQLFW